MLPEAHIPYRIEAGQVRPAFLVDGDERWVASLMADVDRFRGRPLCDLNAHLSQGFPPGAPAWKARAARTVILRLWKAEQDGGLDPKAVRAALFTAAAKSTSRDQAIALAATALGTCGDTLLSSMFADLPAERRLSAPDPLPTPAQVILRTNQAMAKGLLFHARFVRIRVDGSPHALVRQAKLRGLLCNVHDGDPPTLHVSGPYSLFRHTLLYGRALGDLLRFLGGCPRFGLRAACMLRAEPALLTLTRRDPIFPDEPDVPPANKLEARFAKDLPKQAPDWEMRPGDDPLRVGDSLLYPDFRLRRRDGSGRAIAVEILGYWTPDFVAKKLALLDAAARDDVVVCVDTARGTGKGVLPESPRLVPFHKRLSPAAVVAAATARTATDPRP